MNIVDRKRVNDINRLVDPHPELGPELIKISELLPGDLILRKSDDFWYMVEEINLSDTETTRRDLLFKFFGFYIWERDMYNHFHTEAYGETLYFKTKRIRGSLEGKEENV